tara:strand:- start:1004 stop:1402 length:399 start_codon:yes stop_codon:yes gene_type:complete
MIGVTDLIAGIFKPAAELIDSLHTSDEERLDAKSRLLDVQAAAMQQVFTYEASILESQARIVNSEAKSEHWVTATWRPIAMLTFLALAVGDSLGLLATPLRDEAWTLLQIGLGGYVVGRSGEKVMKTLKDSK